MEGKFADTNADVSGEEPLHSSWAPSAGSNLLFMLMKRLQFGDLQQRKPGGDSLDDN